MSERRNKILLTSILEIILLKNAFLEKYIFLLPSTNLDIIEAVNPLVNSSSLNTTLNGK